MVVWINTYVEEQTGGIENSQGRYRFVLVPRSAMVGDYGSATFRVEHPISRAAGDVMDDLPNVHGRS